MKFKGNAVFLLSQASQTHCIVHVSTDTGGGEGLGASAVLNSASQFELNGTPFPFKFNSFSLATARLVTQDIKGKKCLIHNPLTLTGLLTTLLITHLLFCPYGLSFYMSSSSNPIQCTCTVMYPCSKFHSVLFCIKVAKVFVTLIS